MARTDDPVRSALDMTGLLEMALVAARDLPADMQGEITRLILAYPGDEPSPLFAEEAEVGRGDADEG